MLASIIALFPFSMPCSSKILINLSDTFSKCSPMILAASSWLSDFVRRNILTAGIMISLSIIAIVIEQYVQKRIVRARILKNPKCSILFYGKEEKIQLRVKAECEVNYNNDVTKESWKKTGHISRKCYLVTNGPGTESEKPTSGLDNKFDNFDFTKEESEAGYKNFCVIKCKIQSIEWLYLAAKGHRRARFELDNNKEYWLVP